MTKTYKSSISQWTYLMLFLLVLTMVFPFFFMEDLSVQDLKDIELLIYLGISFLVIGLVFWTIFGTYYRTDSEYLYHRSGPFFGKLKISSVRKITCHSGWYVPVLYKPATDKTGLIIAYNKFDEIYFSPKQQDMLIADLLSINPEIEVVRNS